MRLVIKIVAILAIVFSFSVATAAETKSYDYLRIFYYREGKLARESLFTYFKSIDLKRLTGLLTICQYFQYNKVF